MLRSEDIALVASSQTKQIVKNKEYRDPLLIKAIIRMIKSHLSDGPSSLRQGHSSFCLLLGDSKFLSRIT